MTELYEIHQQLDMHRPSIYIGRFQPKRWLTEEWGKIYACECGVFYRWRRETFCVINNSTRNYDTRVEIKACIAKQKPDFVEHWLDYCDYTGRHLYEPFKLNGREKEEMASSDIEVSDFSDFSR